MPFYSEKDYKKYGQLKFLSEKRVGNVMFGKKPLFIIISKYSLYFSLVFIFNKSILKSPTMILSDASWDKTSRIGCISWIKLSRSTFLSLGGRYILHSVIFCFSPFPNMSINWPSQFLFGEHKSLICIGNSHVVSYTMSPLWELRVAPIGIDT